MENKVYHDEDVSLDVLKDKVIAVLGLWHSRRPASALSARQRT